MRTIEVKVYQFNELNEQAKDKARNWWRESGLEYRWWDSVYEDATNIGLEITRFGLDRNRHAKGVFLLSANEVAQNIFDNHGEQCNTYKTAEQFMEDWQPIFNKYMDENDEMYESREAEDDMQSLEDEFLNSLLEDYSVMLQNEYEYLMSDEAVDETIIANGYEFSEDGTIF